ncbi:hypothetical protein U9M48_006070 [Paspalum notatum var. saurae]|uniref:Uncharacterized protein n=1 Tax=Paspalum notatum var. saurae TaxID=547442 RepID=A0AAQ3SLM1_PASNO
MKPKVTPSRLETQVPRVTNQQWLLKVSPSSKLKNKRGRERRRSAADSALKFLQDPLEDLRIWKPKSGERRGGESALSKYVLRCLEVEEAILREG